MARLSFDKLVLEPCLRTFGEANQGFPSVIFKPQLGSPYTIDGVFDSAYQDVSWNKDGVAITASLPVLGCRESSFRNQPLQGDQLVIRGQPYIVREVQDDGHGGLKLMLNNMVMP